MIFTVLATKYHFILPNKHIHLRQKIIHESFSKKHANIDELIHLTMVTNTPLTVPLREWVYFNNVIFQHAK